MVLSTGTWLPWLLLIFLLALLNKNVHNFFKTSNALKYLAFKIQSGQKNIFELLLPHKQILKISYRC
jgi:hypothetical protein